MNIRKIAYRVLRKLEKDKRFPTEEVKDALSRMGERERAFFKELVWGIMRRQIYIDWLLNRYLENPEIPPGVRVVLRIGTYQLLFMDSVPSYAAVSESVKLVENGNFRKLVNAILRRISKDGIRVPKEIHLKYSHPKWIYEELLKWGSIAERIMEDHLKPLPVVLRVNTLKVSRKSLMKRLLESGIEVRETDHSPVGLVVRYNGDFSKFSPVKDGLATVQGESSQIVTFILDPKPNSRILDLACGMGGKTTHMAEYTRDSSDILAIDDSSEKIETLLDNCKRLGIRSVRTAVMDSKRVSDVFKEKFDYILLDAPCTSLGTARKNPDVLLTTKPDGPKKMGKIQLEMMEVAYKLLRSGGKLIYSTCTFTQDESTYIAEEITRRHENLKSLDIRKALEGMKIDYLWDGYGALLLPDGNTLTEFYISAFCRV